MKEILEKDFQLIKNVQDFKNTRHDKIAYMKPNWNRIEMGLIIYSDNPYGIVLSATLRFESKNVYINGIEDAQHLYIYDTSRVNALGNYDYTLRGFLDEYDVYFVNNDELEFAIGAGADFSQGCAGEFRKYVEPKKYNYCGLIKDDMNIIKSV